MNVLLALMTAFKVKGASTLWEALFVSPVFVALLALLQTQPLENVKMLMNVLQVLPTVSLARFVLTLKEPLNVVWIVRMASDMILQMIQFVLMLMNACSHHAALGKIVTIQRVHTSAPSQVTQLIPL